MTDELTPEPMPPSSLPDADAIVIAADGKVSYSKGLQPP